VEDRQQAERELARLHEAIRAQEQTLEFLRRRHETLTAIEQGGWWRLRSRLLPVLRPLAKLRARASGRGPANRSHTS
jgi:hypothetical protein